ncbi:MAG: hypothetical protein ACLFTH_02930 [Candidatus Woesearchaeota archaeon]
MEHQDKKEDSGKHPHRKKNYDLNEIVNRLHEATGHTAALDYEDNRYINIMGRLHWVDLSRNQAYLTGVTTGKGRHLDEFYASINRITKVTTLEPRENYKKKTAYSKNDHTHKKS